MNELITREYHFGGGNAGDDFFTKKATPTVIDDDDEAPGSPVRKTKKEVRQGIAGRHPDSRHRMAHASSLHPAPQVMAELIAKSKAAKHERAQEKDADQAQLEELDATFKQLADVRPAQAASHTAPACPVLTRLPPCAGGRAAQQPADVHGAHEGGSEAGRQPQGQARRARARGRGRRRFRPAGAHAPGATCPPLMRLTCAIRQARMLASDIRASRVTDRLKTADELAAEKAKKLEELERKRMKRMRSRGSDDEAESSDDDAPQGGFKARRLKRQKREPGKKRRETVRCCAFARSLCGSRLTERAGQGDDDLDGNVAFDDGNGGFDEGGSDQPEDEEAEEEEGDDDDETEDPDELRQSFKEKARSINRLGDLRRGKRRLRRLGLLNDGGSVSTSAEEEEEEEEDEEGEGGEDSDEDADEGTGDEAGGDEAEEDAPSAEHREADNEPAAAAASGADGDLPYVFDAPTTHAELARWVDGRPPEELSLVITRICACHAIALAPENRRKMQTFFGVLVVHFERLAQQSPMPSAHLDAMVPHLLALSREVPYYAATVARARLSKMQASVAESQQRGVFEWPPSRTLSLLRLFALIFPASDFRHAVLTPAALLLGQYLAHCEVRSVRDAAVGVLAATLAQELASASKRFVPEVLAFTSSLVHANSRGSAGLPVHHASQMGEPVLAVDLPKGSKAAMLALQVAVQRVDLGMCDEPAELPARRPDQQHREHRAQRAGQCCRPGRLAAVRAGHAGACAQRCRAAPRQSQAAATGDCCCGRCHCHRPRARLQRRARPFAAACPQGGADQDVQPAVRGGGLREGPGLRRGPGALREAQAQEAAAAGDKGRRPRAAQGQPVPGRRAGEDGGLGVCGARSQAPRGTELPRAAGGRLQIWGPGRHDEAQEEMKRAQSRASR